MKILNVVGARPNFMKIAPLLRALAARGADARLIHTGQHYDRQMSGDFFDELSIPEPDINLGVGSGTHVEQIAEVMRRLEKEFIENRPDALVVVGDVNSTLAAALTASKLLIPIAHVEAGLRSFDRTMPEESNRVVVDALSHWLFASEPTAVANLTREGVAAARIHHVGNVMIDTLLAHLETARARNAHAEFGLKPRNFVLVTLHRPSNVDNRETLAQILAALGQLARRLPVVFPMHPRTQKQIDLFGMKSSLGEMKIISPQPYLAMLGLMDAARMVLTDSGGVQEETTALRVPCLTLRENTERPITIDVGSNKLTRCTTADILRDADRLLDRPERFGTGPENWDGRAAVRIADILLDDVPARSQSQMAAMQQ
jgi:UDP-N-acetylglucosamine 2-epimerase (non-hydrolysing)